MNLFKQIRLQHNFTLKEMAIKMGISESLYQKLEYGIKKPSANVIKKAKDAFPEIDTNVFFE